MRQITKIILHCAATPATMDIGVKEIRQWHTMPEPKGRGWRDIGYHYVIRRNGVLEEGRPLEQSGAHCTGQNSCSIGICLVGGVARDGKTPENNFTNEQFDTLRKVLSRLVKMYPEAGIFGHNDFANKACPVFSVREFCNNDITLKERCHATK